MATRLIRALTALIMVMVGLVGFTAISAPAQAMDLNCSDFPNQAAAQRNLDANPSDPNGLDSEGDGVACESNPCPCARPGTSTPNPPSTPPKNQPKPAPKPQPRVLRVASIIKGDVVSVRLGSDRPYRVHLLGATVPKSSCEAKASKRFLKSYLKPGDVVRAVTDKKAPNRDSKGVLRFLIREKGKFNIGLTQVQEGYAKTDRKVNFAFKSKYIRVEKKAKEQVKGYYATC